MVKQRKRYLPPVLNESDYMMETGPVLACYLFSNAINLKGTNQLFRNRKLIISMYLFVTFNTQTCLLCVVT